MSFLRQTIRGCGTLPYVGEHPGLPFAVAMIGAGIVAGLVKAPNALLGACVGGGIMAAVIGPIFLAGAYSRAELSDRLAEKRAALTAPSASAQGGEHG